MTPVININITLSPVELAHRDILMDRHKDLTDNLIFVHGLNALAEEYDLEFADKIEKLRRPGKSYKDKTD